MITVEIDKQVAGKIGSNLARAGIDRLDMQARIIDMEAAGNQFGVQKAFLVGVAVQRIPTRLDHIKAIRLIVFRFHYFPPLWLDHTTNIIIHQSGKNASPQSAFVKRKKICWSGKVLHKELLSGIN
jgi:hypothetical protein